MRASMIQIESLTFSYGQGEPVFENFSWETQRGQTWAVLGPSGCGKSTLLYILAGLRLPNAGKVFIDGIPIQRPRPYTGLIIQDYGLLPWATIRQNVELGLKVRDFYGPDGTHAPRQRQPGMSVDFWLERLGLTPFAEKYPGQVSGGQRQRAAIARTLVLRPDLLLMDEPFSSLDAPTREGLQQLVLELSAEQGLSLIVVTHSIEEAAVLGQHILLLSQPPNHSAPVIDNLNAAAPGYRESEAYQNICRDLRRRLDLT
jgi:NitT/TauT family transport system ATP-binding protein